MPEDCLVAVHGNFASARWWTALRENPPCGWRVLTPDLPGFAGTAPLAEASIPAYASWLRDWLQAQGIERPVLLGHSLGGAVVLEYAALFPGEVAGIILAASAPLEGLVTPEENYPVLEMLAHNTTMRETSLAALFHSEKPENFAVLVEDAGRMDQGHYAGNARALASWQVDARKLKLPALVLGGSEDRLIRPEMVLKQAQLLGAEARIFQERGHGFPQENPTEFREAIEPFLLSVSHTAS